MSLEPTSPAALTHADRPKPSFRSQQEPFGSVHCTHASRTVHHHQKRSEAAGRKTPSCTGTKRNDMRCAASMKSATNLEASPEPRLGKGMMFLWI